MIKVWTAASRPKTLIVGLSPVLIGSTLAMSSGSFDMLTFLFTLLTTFGIQIGTNFSNDYFDFVRGADTSSRIGPLRATQAGLVTPSSMKRAMILAFGIAAICGSYLIWEGGIGFAVLLIVSIVLGMLYTGGPAPLAYLGFADLFAFSFFGPIATCGTCYLQTHACLAESLLVGLPPGAFSLAILTMNNLRDEEQDRAANKRTLVVRFGRNLGKALYLCCLLVVAIFPFTLTDHHPFALLAALTIFPIAFLLVSLLRAKSPLDFVPLFSKTAQVQLVYTFLFCVGWML